MVIQLQCEEMRKKLQTIIKSMAEVSLVYVVLGKIIVNKFPFYSYI
tara:strand:- start:134 stop:271 length:138 start_codon:yes stop_codon:yes gene_type:complete